MAKTLLDLRIEKGLYLKDVAEKTGIPEEELRAVEESGTVPPDIAEILINDYCLTDTYFTVEEVGKLTPQKPMNYFFKVSLIWSVIVGVVGAIPLLITSICAAFLTEGMQTYNIITNLGGIILTVISVLSGVFLAKYILNKTTFKGNIKKYQFLYQLLPDSAVLCVSSITAWLTLIFESKLLNDTIAIDNPLYLLTSLGAMAISLISTVGTFVVAAYFCAKLLNTAVTEDENERSAYLRKLAIIVTVSLVIGMVVYIIRSVTEDFQVVKMIQNLMGYILTIVTAWAVALVKTDNKKIETVVYTVLPILAMIL